MKKNKIFEETYSNYKKELGSLDLVSKAGYLGAEVSNDSILLPFYNRTMRIFSGGIEDVSGLDVSFAVRVVLCKYILLCPSSDYRDERLVTYREFKDAGPLISYFVTNTNKIIESTYSGKGDELKKRCLANGGYLLDEGIYDISVQFYALPKIPVRLNFIDCDDEFSATVSILFQASAERYLDMESLALAGTYLTGILIRDH